MLKNIFKRLLSIVIVLNMISLGFTKEKKVMPRDKIADKNLELLFNSNTKYNSGNDKEFMDILQKYIFGEVFTIGDLDISLRELLTVATLATMQTFPQLKSHINGALNAGNSPIKIREVIYGLASIIGFPKTLNAIYIFNEVIEKRNLTKELKDSSKVNEKNRYKKGYAIQSSIYGDEIYEEFKMLPKNMGKDVSRFLTEVGFGDYYTRDGLDLKTRELVTLVSLLALGNQTALKSHIYGNLNVGNSIEIVIASIIQVMPYIGFPNTFQGLRIVKEVMEDKNLKSNETFCPVFDIGDTNDAYSKYFVGNSYIKNLSKDQVHISNVTFEPKCRNNWHIHNGGGQILLVTDGKGWYQEWGKKPIALKKGDVVNIAPGVKHWHGAASDSWFTHIAIAVPHSNSSTEWLEVVSDKEYKKLK